MNRLGLAVLALAVGLVTASAETAQALEPPAADLEALVTVPGPPNDPVVGQNATFSALVANHGPDPATRVRVAVRMSGEFSVVSITSRASVCAPPDRSGEIVCEVAEIPGGGFLGVVSITVVPTAVGEITISASVSANEADSMPANNGTSASVQIGPARGGDVDLSPRFAPMSDAFVGLSASVSVSVVNSGTDIPSGVRLRVTVSGAVSHLAGSLAPFGMVRDCSPDGPRVLVCDDVRWTWPNQSEQASALIVFVPTEPGLVTFDVEVSANEPDRDPSDNAASVVVPVRRPKLIDLDVELAASSERVRVGEASTYEVAVANNGPDAASDVHFSLAAAEMRVVSIATSSGTCDLTQSPDLEPVSFVACALGRLEAGESVPIRIQALATEGGTFTVTARVESSAVGEVDAESGNDSAAVTTEVTGPNRATTFGAGWILPVSFAAFVPCTGDFVLLEGNLHSSFRLTIDASGKAHLHTHVNAQGVVGVGLISGARYRSTGTWNSHETFSPPLARSFTFVTNQRLIGQGAAADLIVHQNVHVTLGHDGQLRASVDNFRFECR